MKKIILKYFHEHIIKAIAWYMRKICGGASHVYPYGEQGRYIVIMNEKNYNLYTRVEQ